MAQAGGFKGSMDNFKKNKLAIPFSLLLTGLICYFLLIIGSVLFCLLPAVIALVIFALPRYFGLVDRKKALIWGTILILVLGIASGLTYYSILSTEESTALSTPDGVLTAGNITPFRGTDITVFHFSVIYSGTDPNPKVNVTVYDYYLASQGIYSLTNDTTYMGQGDRYVVNKTFPTSIYDFAYSYDEGNGTQVITGLSWGPFTMTNDQILANELWKVPLTMFLNVGLLFYLIVLLTWWMDRSKKRFETQRPRPPAKEEPVAIEKFICSECGSEVPANADKCPQCGEKFEEDERSAAAATATAEPKSSDFICSDCGKTVKESDTQCWNCGKKFEN